MANIFRRASNTCRSKGQLQLGFLIPLHIALSCGSLLYVVKYYRSFLSLEEVNLAHLVVSSSVVIAFSFIAALFVTSRFSFGYALGFYFFTMILGYLWLLDFSTLDYNHVAAGISAFASGVAFLIPAVRYASKMKQYFVLSEKQLHALLSIILFGAAITLLFGASYNLRLVSPTEIYEFRNEIEFPKMLRYAISMFPSVLLPLAYACFVQLGRYRFAALTLLFLLLFYPVTLTKVSLLESLWLIFLTALTLKFEARVATVLSLFLPALAGTFVALLYGWGLATPQLFYGVFGTFNFRMMAISSSALDFYNGFFAKHEPTWFCHITGVRLIVSCPYTEQLSVYMQNTYHLGYWNASLFATEGIASVGLFLAPISAFVCGIVINLVNRASSGLPCRFVLLSGGVILQIFLNVPLTVAFVTHGAGILFVLWYILPRDLLILRGQRSNETTNI